MTFIFWIFKSLLTTLHQLESRGQMVKFKLFASLRTALMVWCAAAGLWALYTMFLTSSEQQLESRWTEALRQPRVVLSNNTVFTRRPITHHFDRFLDR